MLRSMSSFAKAYDPVQYATFTQNLLLVDEQDKVLQHLDKKTTHSWSYINGETAKPHRAFSIFLFNKHGEMLLQQRSHKKITWPLFWSNTCCSHPTSDDSMAASKQDALGRFKFEMGADLTSLPSLQDPIGDLKLISKILYKAKYDEIWGEYELDYLFFMNQSDLETNSQVPFNPDEVENVKWLNRKELEKFISRSDINLTPWFYRLLTQTQFMGWWEDYLKGKIDDKLHSQIIKL